MRLVLERVTRFTCHVETTPARAAELRLSAAPSEALRFRNEAFDGEMCILNASTTGGQLSSF